MCTAAVSRQWRQLSQSAQRPPRTAIHCFKNELIGASQNTFCPTEEKTETKNIPTPPLPGHSFYNSTKSVGSWLSVAFRPQKP